ncbi:sugar ABC transporter permease [Paenibacillus pectinilyticus]|uniref:Sugar ABC transporter permease n=1 Tax=Paenibacillus pectinilyticus TaxID=512399 RepID=A0A1C1A3H5_9BACL|nr:sugar ABC transporter permease [Paenibacillus pectinilyticus]OCT15098.1 sugar ABC transporter permease [Paenibacillus pectinilyticus]
MITTRKKGSARFNDKLTPYLFVAPQLIGYIVFMIIPITFSLYLCFHSWNFTSAAQFTGFDNFNFVFHDSIFLKTIGNTFLIAALVTPLTIVVALILALLCSAPMKGLSFYKSAFFLPMVTSSVSIAMVFYWIYAPDVGLMQFLLNGLSMSNPHWFTDSLWARLALTIMCSWLQIGYYFIIFLAGIKSISPSYYEAASIDGANSFQKFWYITRSMLSPVIFFSFVTLMIYSFNMFNEPYILTKGGPDFSTYTLSMYIYQYAFQSFKLGPASVASWVLFILIGIVTLIQFSFQRKMVNYDT